MATTRRILACLWLVSLVMFLVGCSSTDTKLTPKEAASIKGTGKMPPEAREMMARKMAEARAKMEAHGGMQ